MKFQGNNRRCDKPGRREEDYTTCPFHAGTCYDIQNLEKTMMPRWVMLWVGGPSILLMVAFISWVSLKGLSNTESIIEMRAEQKAISANVGQLMTHFNLTPIKPDLQKK